MIKLGEVHYVLTNRIQHQLAFYLLTKPERQFSFENEHKCSSPPIESSEISLQ